MSMVRYKMFKSFCFLIYAAFMLATCRSQPSAYLTSTFYAPPCKTEGIKGDNFELAYEQSGGFNLMVLKKGSGFTCSEDPKDTKDNSGFPACYVACPDIKQKYDKGFGYCTAVKNYPCALSKTYVPACKKEGHKESKFELSYQERDNKQFMKVKSGDGFSCIVKPEMAQAPAGFPDCAQACPKSEQKNVKDKEFGFCPGTKEFECGVPESSAEKPGASGGGGAGGGGDANRSGSLSYTLYEPDRFRSKCNNPGNNEGAIAPSEGMAIFDKFTCVDNWVEVYDPNNAEDIEHQDLEAAKAKHSHIRSKRDYLEEGLKLCNGSCVKKDGGKYYVNKPTCNKICDIKTIFTITNLTNNKRAKVYLQSACPKNHWKNLLKVYMGTDAKNHCGSSDHVDVEVNLRDKLGLTEEGQKTDKLEITK